MKEQFTLYRSLGSTLIEKGKWFLNKAIPTTKHTFTSGMIVSRVKEITGSNIVNTYDAKYTTTDIETWKTIIEFDWINKKKWIEDTFDCDNFAGSFSAHCADIYGLNTAGRFTVELLNPKDDSHIGYHRAVIIIDNKLDCYLLESQTDEIVKIEKGKHPIIGKWKYKVNYISFN